LCFIISRKKQPDAASTNKGGVKPPQSKGFAVD
jgi:hypothetical protein